MKLKKEEVYIKLQGKSKEELTDLWEFLTSNGEIISDNKEYFVETHLKYNNSFIALDSDNAWKWWGSYNKTEVTIEQLKEMIIKPSFTPIAMKCTQEQFEAIKPKLCNCKIRTITNFNEMPYLINNRFLEQNNITNYIESDADDNDRIVHEEWNEEVFLKACGIEVEKETPKQEIERLKARIDEIENENKVMVNLLELPTELQEQLKKYL